MKQTQNNTEAMPDFKIGDKVKDLSNIEGTVIEVNPGVIRVAFGQDGKSNWRDLNPKYLTLTPLQDKGNGHTPGQWSPVYSIAFLQPNQDFISVTVRSDKEHGHQKIADIECKHTQKEEVKANAELIASAPQLKADNEKIKEQNARAKQQIIDLIEALTPFADVWNEFTEIKRRQGGEVFQYNHKKLLVTDFEKANDLLSYLSHHQVK